MRQFFSKALCFILFGLLLNAQYAHSVACTDIFTNGIQATATNGNIALSYFSKITGGSATLKSKTLTDNSSLQACSGSSCVAAGVAATQSTPTFLTGNGSDGAINLGYRGSQSINGGQYTTISVGQEASLRFNNPGTGYKTGAMSTSYKSVLEFRPGDYWINGNLTIGQETELKLVSGTGPVRIFVNGNISFGFKAYTSGFSSSDLLIYATGSISSANELTLSAYLYAGGNVSLNYRSVINGAVSGANFTSSGNEVTVNYEGANLTSVDFSPFCSGGAVAPVLLGSWHMDEGSWSGAANEVVDSSGNNNHGRARIAAGSSNLPTTASGNPAYASGNQNTCYYGSFDGVGSPARSHTYVELTGFPSLPQGFTFAAWIKSSNAGAQHQRILVRDDAQNGWGFSLADGTGQPKLRFFGRNITNNGAVTGQGSNPNCGVFCIDSNPVISSNQWHYVAAVVDTQSKTITLYVYSQARVLLAKTSGGYSGTWTDGSGLAAIGGETSASGEGQQSSWHFLGNIDEVNIYSGALAQASIETLMQTVRTCAGPDHYELQLASETIACEGAKINIRACANSAVPCTVDASVNTNVTLNTDGGVLTASTLAMSAGEASTVLKYPTAADNTLVNLNLSNEITLANNARKCCTGSSNCNVSNSCATTFKRAGFIFSNSPSASGDIPNQVAGVTDSSVYLRAVKSNTNTGACVARFTSPQTVEVAYQCRNPITCITGQSLLLGAASAKSNANAVAVGSIQYSNASLAFDANGSANIPVNYSDVGQVKLYARLALPDTVTEPAYTLTGISNDFVVKPHKLLISAVSTLSNSANPSKTNEAGGGFVAAGENFKVSVQAQNAANAVTPNFGKEQTPEINNMGLLVNTLVYPAGGALTALTNGGSFVATTPVGTFVNSGIQWNQVGSITLRANLTDSDYLGAGNILNYPVSATVGRFYPDHYFLAAASATDMSSALACTTAGSTPFSYMGEPKVGLTYELRARGVGGTILSNYDNTDQAQYYAASMATPSYVAENNNIGNGDALFNARLIVPAVTWNDGVLSLNSSSATFARATASGGITTPDGPYASLQFGLKLIDTFDSRSLQNLDMNSATTGACSGAGCTAVQLGTPLSFRFGRLRLDDAFGPETASLPVTFVTQYWTGGYFANNVNDSCSSILRSAISYPAGNLLTAANLTVNLTGGSTQGVYGGLTATGVKFTAGSAQHYFQQPSGGATGNFIVEVDLAAYPWLRFDWDQNGDFNNDSKLPKANFGFGQYRGHDRIIYWRERFQ